MNATPETDPLFAREWGRDYLNDKLSATVMVDRLAAMSPLPAARAAVVLIDFAWSSGHHTDLVRAKIHDLQVELTAVELCENNATAAIAPELTAIDQAPEPDALANFGDVPGDVGYIAPNTIAVVAGDLLAKIRDRPSTTVEPSTENWSQVEFSIACRAAPQYHRIQAKTVRGVDLTIVSVDEIAVALDRLVALSTAAARLAFRYGRCPKCRQAIAIVPSRVNLLGWACINHADLKSLDIGHDEQAHVEHLSTCTHKQAFAAWWDQFPLATRFGTPQTIGGSK